MYVFKWKLPIGSCVKDRSENPFDRVVYEAVKRLQRSA